MELGHEVTIITLRHDKQWEQTETLNGLPIIRVGGLYNAAGMLRIGRLGHLPIDILMFLTLWRLRHRFDVFHSLQLSTLAAMATIISKFTAKPIIISIPSTGPGKKQLADDATLMADTLANTLTNTDFLKVPFNDIVVGDIAYLSKSAFGGSAIVTFLKKSAAFYQLLSSRSYPYMISHGFRKEKLTLIPNGVDTNKFQPAPELRPDPAQPERDILCTARLQYPKGIDVLLHAWGRMMHEPAAWRAHLKPKLLIAGEGPLLPQLERITAELGIQDSVEFMGLQRNVIPLLQKAWGFVMPSRWEGMPNAVLESMACGLPTIATRVSGSEDIIVNGVNGLLVEPEQPEELAQALRSIIEDPNYAHKLAQEGRATVVQEYRLERIIEKCVELYQCVLSQDKSAQPLELQEVGR
jgi:glycosyltransferase involved in cell wall biosynthesis